MGRDENKRKSIRNAKIVTEVCISAVILSLGGYAIYKAVDKAEPIGTVSMSEASDIEIEITEPETEAPDPNQLTFITNAVKTTDKFKGDLILVNNDVEYIGGNEQLAVINEKLDEDGRTSFVGNDYNMQILEKVYEPLASMLDDFNEATNYDDIVIIGGYRTKERQQELYDEDLASTGNDTSERVALPGHSEHESGYALDFTTSTTWDYDGTGKYDWINKNCCKYGFILRYAEDKTDITNIQYEPWHYRYVGIPHANYIYDNGLCLEEYIDLVREHPYDGEHLKFKDTENKEYEVYFFPSDDSSETTFVPIPASLKYDISGNNVDGFIVTVYLDEKADNSSTLIQDATEAPTEESTEDASEEETAEDETSSDEESSEESVEDSEDSVSEESDESAE